MTAKFRINAKNARQVAEWLAARGGIAVWKSVNLSNPNGQWITPAKDEAGAPYGKPTWQAANAPERVITDPNEIEVETGRLFKRFHVGLRRGAQGLSFKLTDAASRCLRETMSRAGPDSWYEFDYSEQDALVFVPAEVLPFSTHMGGSNVQG